jgi:hypothetical protein
MPNPSTTNPRQVVHDEPWSPDDPDLLRRRAFGKRVAEVVGERQDSAGLVIAIYGPWGEGKTSVLRMIRQELATWPDILPIEFNPWFFRDEEHLLGMFFATLAERLKIKLGSVGEEIGRSLRKYGTALGAAPTEIAGIPNVGKMAEAIGDWFQPASLAALRDRIERGIEQSGQRPVVIIDDIDRLDRAGINAVTKLVKLIAGFSYTTYILAFDDDVVAAALAGRYADDLPSARDYLDKIVQVPLRLPPADQSALLQITLGHVDRALVSSATDVDEDGARRFIRYFRPLYVSRLRTVRTAKRFGNALAFAFPLLRGEVNVVDLLLLESIRALYPGIYSRLRLSREFLTSAPGQSRSRTSDDAAAARDRLSLIVGSLSADEQRALLDLLRALFPFLKAQLGEVSYGYDVVAEMDAIQSVGSPNYCDRYFQYSIPAHDVPDVEIGRLEAALTDANIARATELFESLLSLGGVRRLLERLRTNEHKRDVAAARCLLLLLGAYGASFPRTEGFLAVFESPQGQAAILAANTLRRIPDAERAERALALVREVQPTHFALELRRWFTSSGDERAKGNALLSLDEERRLDEAAADRLRGEWRVKPFYMRPHDEAQPLLNHWAWLIGRPETESVLRHEFDKSPEHPAALVWAFVPTAYSLESGLSFRSELRRDSYESIARLIEPSVLLEYGRRLYPHLDDEHEGTPLPSKELGALVQFAMLHRRAVLGAEPAPPSAHSTDADVLGTASGVSRGEDASSSEV